MTDKVETIADIVAKLRKEAEEFKADPTYWYEVEYADMADYDLELADRIEAAHAREIEIAKFGKVIPRGPQEFDEAAFGEAVSRPRGWDAVADPVAEIRRMRGDLEEGMAEYTVEHLDCAEWQKEAWPYSNREDAVAELERLLDTYKGHTYRIVRIATVREEVVAAATPPEFDKEGMPI